MGTHGPSRGAAARQRRARPPPGQARRPCHALRSGARGVARPTGRAGPAVRGRGGGRGEHRGRLDRALARSTGRSGRAVGRARGRTRALRSADRPWLAAALLTVDRSPAEARIESVAATATLGAGSLSTPPPALV